MTTITCDNCGACCREMHSPPFVFLLDGIVAIPCGGQDPDEADIVNFDSLPESDRQAYRDHIESDAPDASLCLWYDPETHRCRNYDLRPEICRDFVVGDEACLNWRELFQIQI